MFKTALDTFLLEVWVCECVKAVSQALELTLIYISDYRQYNKSIIFKQEIRLVRFLHAGLNGSLTY